VAAPGTGTWQHLALTFNGATIAAAINGTTVGTVTDSSYASGMVGFGTSGTTEGTQLDLWTCNGGANQQWSVP
jgi:hypothetical protein